MAQFLSGAMMAASFVIALLFLRFWKASRDRLFGAFAISFALMGIERIFLNFAPLIAESRSYWFLFRLLAFIIILWAVVDKNRERKSRPDRVTPARDVVEVS